MATWQTTTKVKGEPEHVLDVLTDPSSARRWSPIGFELEEIEGDRLRSGTRAVLTGKLAGRGVSFDVHVLKASDGQLELRAVGPVEMDVNYDAVLAAEGTEAMASVAVRSAGGLGEGGYTSGAGVPPGGREVIPPSAAGGGGGLTRPRFATATGPVLPGGPLTPAVRACARGPEASAAPAWPAAAPFEVVWAR